MARKEDYLRSLGVDPTYLGQSEYDMALIMSSAEQMERDYNSIKTDADKLYSDLGVSTETEYREPAA